MRHMNAKGHLDLSNLISSFLKDVTCELVLQPDFTVPLSVSPPSMIPLTGPITSESLIHLDQDSRILDKVDLPAIELAHLEDKLLIEHQKSWPIDARTWRKNPTNPQDGIEQIAGELMPGLWTSPLEYSLLPRLPVLSGWNSDINVQVPPFRPTCLSTRAEDELYQLTPAYSDGWFPWTHPEHLDKPYLMANATGARVEFELETNVGVVKMYSLRSRSFGLGMVECWTDEDREGSVKVDGFWDNDMLVHH
jgi:hypothetical protein